MQAELEVEMQVEMQAEMDRVWCLSYDQCTGRAIAYTGTCHTATVGDAIPRWGMPCHDHQAIVNR